jgi:hypothetical protein
MKLSRYHSLLLLLIFAGGCQKQGPVSLIDDQPSNPVVVAPNSTSPDGAFGTDDIDSARLFPPVASNTLGQLIVAGSAFDSKTEHHDGSLTRAIFFDRTAPVIVDTQTVGYKTLNAGIVSIDDIPLIPREKRLQIPLLSLDTLLGIQYALVNRDGIGGRGFQYVGNHAYRWSATGLGAISAFTVDVESPATLHVDSPLPDATVSISHNLRVHWTGGGTSVNILISEVQSGLRARPLIRLRVGTNQGGTVIPSALLQILRNRAVALFTFTSENSSIVSVSGYPDQIRVAASSTHNLLLSLGP